jgi:methylamine---glutamate N-methyltransferase subunit C
MTEDCEGIWPGGPGLHQQDDPRTFPGFDDLILLPASLSLKSSHLSREPVGTRVRLGTRYASRPLELHTPLLLAPTGLCSRPLRLAVARTAARLQTAYNTGEAGLLPAESDTGAALVLQIGCSRLGISPQDLKKLAAIEIVLNTANHGICLFQPPSAKPLGLQLPIPPAPPGFLTPAPVIDFHNLNTLRYKVLELREATDYEIPICFRAGGDTAEVIRLAAACEVDLVTLDGLQAGFPAGPEVLRDHVGLPPLAALAQARRTLETLDLQGDIDLVVTGGVRDGADAAKCLALGARAVALGDECLTALGLQSGPWLTAPGDDAAAEMETERAAANLLAYCNQMTRQMQMIVKACGKDDVLELGLKDVRALTRETAAVTGAALAGSDRRSGIEV